jgi:DNA-binding MarR family transcriptional regulator
LTGPTIFDIVGSTNVDHTNILSEAFMSTSSPLFSTRAIGQAEKALNAILARELAGTGLDEPQWVTLTVAATTSGPIARREFLDGLAGALKATPAQAAGHLDRLAAAGLVDVSDDASAIVHVTDAGRALHAQVRERTVAVTDRMWGDLPADDLAAAGRVLATVLERANAELAGGR